MTGTENAILPLMPLRDMAPQPGTTLPMFVGRDISKNAVRAAASAKSAIILVAQKSIAIEKPRPADLYGVGVLGEINQITEHPDGALRIVVTSKSRGYLHNISMATSAGSELVEGRDSVEEYFTAEFEQIEPAPASADVSRAARAAVKSFAAYCTIKEDTLLAETRQLLGRLHELQNQIQALRAANDSIGNLADPVKLADLIPGCIHTQVQPDKLSDPAVVNAIDSRIRAKQAILSEPDPAKRLKLLRKFVEEQTKK